MITNNMKSVLVRSYSNLHCLGGICVDAQKYIRIYKYRYVFSGQSWDIGQHFHPYTLPLGSRIQRWRLSNSFLLCPWRNYFHNQSCWHSLCIEWEQNLAEGSLRHSENSSSNCSPLSDASIFFFPSLPDISINIQIRYCFHLTITALLTSLLPLANCSISVPSAEKFLKIIINPHAYNSSPILSWTHSLGPLSLPFHINCPCYAY